MTMESADPTLDYLTQKILALESMEQSLEDKAEWDTGL